MGSVTTRWVSRLLGLGAILAAACHGTTLSKCDVNLDGATNIADVQALVNQALGIKPPNFDLNNDGVVNVADVQIDLNAVLNMGCAPDAGTISNFTPQSGPIGTAVMVTGSNFGSAPQVSMAQQGGGSIVQPVLGWSPTSLTFVVAAGSATGPITLSNGTAGVNTGQPFTVTPANTFTLSASPPAANLIAGQSVSYAVRLSSSNGFGQLAALSVAGVPTSVTATFVPQSITAGQTAVLTLTAPANQALSANTNLSITAAATVSGLPVSQDATVSLSVVGPTTTLLGRTTAADNLETPLTGVTITSVGQDGNGNTTGCTGQATTSDGAGNFALSNLPMSCTGPQLFSFNGGAVTSPAGKYAGVNLAFTIVQGQVTVSPINVHLPRIDNAETFYVQQNYSSDQTYSYSTIPGLKVVVYAGTTITMQDGSKPNPYPLAAIQVPADRLPDVKAQVPTMMMALIVAFQPENSTASQPVAVYYPNTLNTPAGDDFALITLDPQRGTMVPYGTGAVAPDGSDVIPDADPAHPGHLYGLLRPGWHFCAPPPPILTAGPPEDDGGGGPPGWGDNDNGWGRNDNGWGNYSPYGPPAPNWGENEGLGWGNSLMPPPDPPDPPDPDACPEGGCNDPDIVDVPKKKKPLSPPNQTGGGAIGIPIGFDRRPQAGGPIDLASGLDILRHTDLEIDGAPLSLRLIRGMYTDSNFYGPFGLGGDHNFDYAIDTGASNSAAMFNLVMPFGARHLPFVRQADGTLVNTVAPAFAGAVFTTAQDNSSVLRLRRGLTMSFSPGGYLVSVADPNGNTITILRNVRNEVTSIADTLGRQLTFNYTPSGPPLITSIADSTGRTVNYTYNTGLQLTSFTDANGGVWQYSYNGAGNLATVTDPRGVVLEQNTYDANGRVISQTQADGGNLQFAYTYYNPTAPANSPILTTTVTDQLGRQRVYRFNSQGYLLEVTDPLGQSRSFTRAPGTNFLLSLTGPGTCPVCGNPRLGDVSYTYDVHGNILSQSDSLGDTFHYTYDPVFSEATSLTDPKGAVTRYQLDSRGNVTAVTDPRGNQTVIAIGPFGLPMQVTDPANQTTKLLYDAYGNLVSVQDALGDTTTLAYDQLFRPAKVIGPSGAQSFRTWDVLDRLVRQTDGNGGVTAFTYDSVGNLLTMTDPRGSQTTWVYDSLSRVIAHSDGLGRQEQFGYDAVSNLTSRTDRRGQTAQFAYDILDRLVTQTYSDSSVSRTYDANSRMIQANDSQSGVFAFEYDSPGRVLNSVSPVGAVSYVRDGLGRMLSRQATGLPKVTYQYDPAGNLTQAAMTQASVSLTYDVRNLLSNLSRSNSVSSGITRDPLARVLSIAHQAGNNVLASFSYSYDAAGNRSTDSTALAQTLTTQAATATYNGANEMSAFGTQSLTYDANGNRLTETASGGTTTYTWDGRNRLQSITQPGGVTTQFTYDFWRNLIRQTATANGSASTTSYLLDQTTNIVAILPAGGSPVSLLTGVKADSHFATVNAAGQAEFALHDVVASVAATSGSSAALDGTNLFEPFGQTISTGAGFPFAFTGRVPVAGGSVYYFRTRYYDPAAGRFLSEDVNWRGDVNLYRFVNNNPLWSADPFGLSESKTVVISLDVWGRRQPRGIQ